MAIDGYDEAMWQAIVSDVAGPDYAAGVIPVEAPIESIADLYGSIEDAMWAEKITRPAYEEAVTFLGKLLETEDPEAVVRDLGYVEDFDGLKLTLKLPGQADEAA